MTQAEKMALAIEDGANLVTEGMSAAAAARSVVRSHRLDQADYVFILCALEEVEEAESGDEIEVDFWMG